MAELFSAVFAAVLLGVLLDLAASAIARRERVLVVAAAGSVSERTPVDHHLDGWPAGRLVVPSVSTLLAAACALRRDEPAVLITLVPMVCLVTELAVIDIGTRRLPNLLTLPAIPLGAVLVCVAAWLGTPPDRDALIVVAVVIVAAPAISWWWPAGLGMGDAKLICAVVALVCPVGVSAVWGAALGGLVLSGLFSAALVVSGRRATHRTVAAGPFLAAGAVLAVLLAT